ncbi:MAG: AarF/ABC1/UbiB kinase family protein [Bacteroidetes bacterium]|jgi:predicted unusual protein kinase regulating ubiquinone biosynthesis (AarF/ABC1/UbiB family)|nr:AarF/ABC1/UbiB kinase family protein [Bacteroidota bacterium]
METIDKLPISKVKRASKLIQTGAKVGTNYLKYYGNKLIYSEVEAKTKLDEANASDIYNSLKNLKGSPLKVAQMLSMDKSILPQAYVDQFSLAQFSVPPLSSPLVTKTFTRYFGQSPQELFDHFDPNATNAATIGQVHKAQKDGKTLAIKIQYPGVADSISSDLALVKPIAMRMFNIKGQDSDKYFREVEQKLIDETDYTNEIRQSVEVAKACRHIPNLKFPNYYPEYSTKQIIAMDWMTGQHLSEFSKENINQELANQVGQTLWDFYMYQIHSLKKVHADPHPGNFLVDPTGTLVALDFGCMKEIPNDFYIPYFELTEPEIMQNKVLFMDKLVQLEIIRHDDTEEEKAFFGEMFHDLLQLFTRPLTQDTFDFSDQHFFNEIANLGEQFAKNTTLRKMNGNRGSKHFIYVNRTFFGLYNLMHEIGAKSVTIQNVAFT